MIDVFLGLSKRSVEEVFFLGREVFLNIYLESAEEEWFEDSV